VREAAKPFCKITERGARVSTGSFCKMTEWGRGSTGEKRLAAQSQAYGGETHVQATRDQAAQRQLREVHLARLVCWTDGSR
jgi:hypothetical protein